MFRRFGHGEEPDFQGALSLGCCFEIPALTPTPLPEGEGQLQGVETRKAGMRLKAGQEIR